STELDRGFVNEVAQAHTGDLGRVLETLQEAESGAFVDREIENLDTVELRRPADLVPGLAGQNMTEGRLARSVRTHDGVDLAQRDLDVQTLQDLLVGDAGTEAGHAKSWIHTSSSVRY